MDQQRARAHLCPEAPARIEDDDLAHLLEALEEFLREVDHPYCFILLVEHLTQFTARQRAMWAEVDRRLQPIERVFNKGQAYVMSSWLTRGILTATHWLAPPVYPTIVVPTKDDAIAWARRQLAPHLEEVPAPG